MEIRKPNDSDIDGIINVLGSYNFHVLPAADGARLDPDFGEILSLRNSVSELDLDHAFVAVTEGVIAGFSHYAAMKETVAKTTLMAVLPGFRKHGFGKALQCARMKEAFERGHDTMFTATDNEDSARWYRKYFGYKVTGSEPVRHQLHFIRADDRIMWGVHYGLTGSKELTLMETDLMDYFKDAGQ
jgi:ribosomal protein S18 acetylase RimI-like enzyme